MRHWMIAALLTLLPAAAIAGTPLPDAPHLVVQGEGKASVAPDSVTVSMTASHRSASAAEAKQKVDRAVEALLRAAPGFDVSPDDASASDLGLYEHVEHDGNGRRVHSEHIANREVKVKLDDLDRLGAWIETALEAGFTSVSGISFTSSREAELRKEARARAVADAREKASGLAGAFDARLGPVYSINSLDSMQAQGYGNVVFDSPSPMDSVTVTGSRMNTGRYLQPTIDFTERVSAVFEIRR